MGSATSSIVARAVLLTSQPPFSSQGAFRASATKPDTSAGGAQPCHGHGVAFVAFNLPLSALAAVLDAPRDQPCALIVDTIRPHANLADWLAILGNVQADKLATGRLKVFLVAESTASLTAPLQGVKEHLAADVIAIPFELGALAACVKDACRVAA